MLFLFAEEPADVGDSQAEFVFTVIFTASDFACRVVRFYARLGRAYQLAPAVHILTLLRKSIVCLPSPFSCGL